jgi:hypothetical protein
MFCMECVLLVCVLQCLGVTDVKAIHAGKFPSPPPRPSLLSICFDKNREERRGEG